MSGGGRTLGGGDAEPLPEGWGASSGGARIGRVGGPSTARAAPSSSGGPRIASLRDVASSGPAPMPSRHDHSDGDDSDDDGAGENWFTGGERSGLNVENPNRPSGPTGTVRDILRKAAQAPRAPEESAPSASSGSGGGSNWFSGGGHTLGSDEVPSQAIPDPNAAPAPGTGAGAGGEEQETAIRNLTFWREGFSIDDGELMRYDVPENQRILDAINSGNAPPSILGVQINQPVELRVARRMEESYVPPPKKLELFSGSGNRLGSPVPSSSNANPAAPTGSIPGAFPGAASVGGGAGAVGATEERRESITTRFEVDLSAPNTSIQIRLADGTRLVSRMNLTHTVGDIRGFINASRPASEQRPYTIGTTFPNKTLDDDSLTIDAAGLKNSVIVQRLV